MALFSPRVRKPDENGSAATHERHGKLGASAQRLTLDNRKALKNQAVRRQEWQDEAWAYFDDIGEIKFTAGLSGNIMSKLRFFVAVRPLDEPEGDPISVFDEGSGIPAALAQRATAELERLKSPFGGRAEIVRMLQINLEIAAEAYLVGIGPRSELVDDPVTGEKVEQITAESWEIKSVDEVDTSSGDGRVKIKITPGDMQGFALDPEKGDVIVRIWSRHPRWSFLPDCAMRGVLGVCESVVLLENQVKAIAKSHASAGFMLFPNELDYGRNPTLVPEGEGDADEGEPPFWQAYHETLIEPIEDPASAAAVAPMPIQGPAESLKEIRHLSIHRETDQTLEPRIEGRVLRMARGLNYPVETTTGLMATTFANAAQVDEDKYKEHWEPRAILICDSFTVGFLQPNLIAAGENVDLVDRLFVWADPSALLKSVDPVESAKEALDLGTISEEAYRREKGWTEDDAPDPVERLVRAVMHLRSFDPGVSTAILELLDVPLDIPQALPTQAAGTPAQASTPRTLPEALLMLLAAHKAGREPSLPVRAAVAAVATPEALSAARKADGNVGRRLMDLDRDLRVRLQREAHHAMNAVLTKAGNRIKTKVMQQMSRKSPDVAMIRTIHPRYAAEQLGPVRLAAAGINDTDLFAEDAWDALEQQFMTWGGAAQVTAINLASSLVGISKGERAALRVRQATDLAEAWQWMRSALGGLAARRLYEPDPLDPAFGEFDPNSSVPTGLVRQAVARAGGATGLIASADGVWVVTNNGQPPGGIGTGELISETLTNGGASVEGYEWVYGPAYRARPFEEHEALDGMIVDALDSDDLSAEASWLASGTYYPGDHDGCQCDISPVLVGPGNTVFNEASGEAHFADSQE